MNSHDEIMMHQNILTQPCDAGHLLMHATNHVSYTQLCSRRPPERVRLRVEDKVVEADQVWRRQRQVEVLERLSKPEALHGNQSASSPQAMKH